MCFFSLFGASMRSKWVKTFFHPGYVCESMSAAPTHEGLGFFYFLYRTIFPMQDWAGVPLSWQSADLTH